MSIFVTTTAIGIYTVKHTNKSVGRSSGINGNGEGRRYSGRQGTSMRQGPPSGVGGGSKEWAKKQAGRKTAVPARTG